MKKNKYVTVLLDTDPHLREISTPVSLPLSKKDKETLQSLLTYVEDSRDETLQEEYQLKAAVGLAAPQIGVNKQMLAIVLEENKDDDIMITRLALANPKIISHSEQMSYLKQGEGCLSVEDIHEGYIPRYARIKIEAYDMLQDKTITLRVSGYLAVIVQHEMDHLKGILYYDRINKQDPFYEIPNAIVIE